MIYTLDILKETFAMSYLNHTVKPKYYWGAQIQEHLKKNSEYYELFLCVCQSLQNIKLIDSSHA